MPDSPNDAVEKCLEPKRKSWGGVKSRTRNHCPDAVQALEVVVSTLSMRLCACWLHSLCEWRLLASFAYPMLCSSLTRYIRYGSTRTTLIPTLTSWTNLNFPKKRGGIWWVATTFYCYKMVLSSFPRFRVRRGICEQRNRPLTFIPSFSHVRGCLSAHQRRGEVPKHER